MVGLVGLAVREDGPHLHLARSGSTTVLALAAPQFLTPHGGAGSVGADAEDVPGGGMESRSLGFPPPGQARSHLRNQALDLTGIDLQTRIVEQVLAAGLITARQGCGTAHPTGDEGRVALG